MKIAAKFFLLISLLLLPVVVFGEDQKTESEKDQTGTNPVYFTNDFRMFFEHQDLPGGGTFGQQVYEFNFPYKERIQLQYRAFISRLTSAGGGPTTTGLSDMTARILWAPWISKKYGLGLGLEGFFDTASFSNLGSGRTALGPQVVFVFFLPYGILLAPAYQYKFHVGGNTGTSISTSQIDIFTVWRSPKKKHWVKVNPQIIIDHENSKETFILELEAGQIMFGPLSSYVRPGVHLGGDRGYDWNVEFGFKVIWL